MEPVKDKAPTKGKTTDLILIIPTQGFGRFATFALGCVVLPALGSCSLA